MAAEFISRSEAKARGLVHYFTGEHCSAGHVAARYTSSSKCIVCNTDAAREWRKTNKARENEITRQWRGRNPGIVGKWRKKNLAKGQKYSKRWRSQNLEKARQGPRNWRKHNKEQVNALTRNRRARTKFNGGSHTAADIAEILRLQRYRCAAPNCRNKLSDIYDVDHIVPLVRGGSNDRSNLQIMCSSCNRSKGAKDPILFAQECGFLI